MMKQLFFGLAAMATSVVASAQANCGATAAEFNANATPMGLLVTQTTTAPTFIVNPAGLPNTDFVITLKDSASLDGLGPAIIGAQNSGNIFAPDFGMTIGDSFYVYAFSYDLQQIKVLIHSLFSNEFFPGLTCCAGAQLVLGTNFCGDLSAAGISDSSDVQSVSDLFAVMSAFSGGAGSLSMSGLVSNLDALNSQLAQFGNCSGGLMEICYAVDTMSFQYYAVTGIAVTDIMVAGQGGVTDITTAGGTLQAIATIIPANATAQDVDWTINNQTGVAFIDQTGLITAYSNGTVEVVATATDGSGISGSMIVTLSNQSNIAVTNISVTPVGGVISTQGGTLQMAANVLPANATNSNVVWSLSAGGFLGSIDQNGLLTAYGSNDGVVTVRATAADGSGIYGETQVELVNQAQIPLTSITILPDTAIINTINGTFLFNADLLPEDATNTNLNWSIIGSSLSADINNTGLATGYMVDTVLVVAESAGTPGVSDTAVLVIRDASNVTTISNDASLQLNVAPNPCQDYLQLSFACQKTADYQLRLVDMLGQTAWTATQNWSAGQYQYTIETRDLPAGMYWLQVQYGGGMIAQKVVKN